MVHVMLCWCLCDGEDRYDDRMAATVPIPWDMQHQCCVGHCVKGYASNGKDQGEHRPTSTLVERFYVK